MINLQKMNPESFASWNVQIWKLYRDELIRSGMSATAADENVDRNIEETMPNGVLLEGNFVFDVMHQDVSIGSVWLSDKGSEWFIYDIDIDETQRGKGFGRQTMKAIEEFVRSHNGVSIGLSVFGFNTVALKLYETEGYETVRISMQKKLEV